MGKVLLTLPLYLYSVLLFIWSIVWVCLMLCIVSAIAVVASPFILVGLIVHAMR